MLEKIPSSQLALNPTCMILSKDMLIRGIRNGLYDDDEMEVVEDKVEEEYESLFCLAIRNRALVLQNDGDLCKEIGFIMGKGMNPKFLVKAVDLIDSQLFLRRLPVP